MDNQSEQQNIEEKFGVNVLEKIKEDRIKPRPKWAYMALDYFLWLVVAACLVFAVLAKAAALFTEKNTYWSYFWNFSWTTKAFFLGLPMFWLAILFLFVILALYFLKLTKHGYRYSSIFIVLIILVLSIVLSILVYAFGLGEKVESVFYHRLIFYREINDEQSQRLISREEGRVAGMVIDTSNNYIMVKDLNGKIWQVNTSSTNIISGQRVILVGQWINDDNFQVDFIQPWFKSSGQVIDLCPVCH